MYIKIENQENARRFTFFKKERIVKGEKVYNTDKSVFGTLSEGIKVGEVNGQAVWENDYWNVTFCGKAYEKALTLKDKDKVGIKTKQRETKFVSARELNVVVSNRIYSLEDNLPKFANMIFAKYEESLQKEQKRLESKKAIYENLKQAIQELGEN